LTTEDEERALPVTSGARPRAALGDKQTDLQLPGEEPQPAAPSEPPPIVPDEQELREAVQTEFAQLKEAARFATPERALQVLEALFFAAEKPLDIPALEETTQFAKELIYSSIAELSKRYAPGAGVVLFDLGGRWQLRTDPQVGAYVRRMLQVKPMRLTRAALETLAIVAYRQPITRPELEDLRGVDCGAVTKALLERKLIRILGKKDEPGRPLLYGTSKEFLELFNLRDLTQLPTLREFQELSEESRKIVEEETPAPPVAGLTEMASDPAVAERLAQAGVESDAALAQLESAMERAEESTKSTSVVLDPPKPEAVPVPAPPRENPKED
jgi:segregation and condensation protein B